MRFRTKLAGVLAATLAGPILCTATAPAPASAASAYEYCLFVLKHYGYSVGSGSKAACRARQNGDPGTCYTILRDLNVAVKHATAACGI